MVLFTRFCCKQQITLVLALNFSFLLGKSLAHSKVSESPDKQNEFMFLVFIKNQLIGLVGNYTI